MILDTPMKELLFTTVHIHVESPQGMRSGTGFIYNAARNGGATPVLVTNKHVIECATRGVIRLLRRHGNAPHLGSAIEVSYTDFLPLWTGHASPEVDVAAMFLGPTLNAAAESGHPPFFKMAGPDLCPSADVIRYLDAVETVTFIGYPNGLYDRANNTPIVRQGTTATPVELNWNGTPTFLVDGSVFPGSSGSPVFLVQQGIYRQEGGFALGGASRVFFLGLVAAVMIQRDSGQVVVDAPGPSVVFNQVMDLGIVYKWTAIEEAVDALCANNGIDRASLVTTRPANVPDAPAEVAELP